MKKLLFIIIIFFSFIFIYRENNDRKAEKKIEKRGIFISYIELKKYIKDKDNKTSKENIDKIIKNIKDSKFNMIILQVRSFSDAIYKSNIFPWSEIVSSEEGIYPGYDILDYFIKQAHFNKIELHAWINPYRIRSTNNIDSIIEDNPAYKWLNTNNVSIIEKGIYYNPASSEVENLILDGIRELVNNYDVDGIHFDDYFYPNNDIDNYNYSEYIKDNNISLRDYRLMIINNLIKKIYKITKEKGILFGISPEGNIENNYNINYADVYTWGSSNGYVDYLMPQIYYGFTNEVKPFYRVLDEWDNLIKNSNIKLIPALSLYKSGEKDIYAKSGENEWIENDNILMKQILISRNKSNYNGFSIFRYDYMYSDEKKSINVINEIKNIKKII